MRIAVAAALLVILGLTSARADLVYIISIDQISRIGFDRADIVGTIITDGAFGALSPQDILGGQYTVTVTDTLTGNLLTTTTNSAINGSWTPGSLTATDSALTFDFGSQFTNVLGLAGMSFTGPIGERLIDITREYVPRVNLIASRSNVVVPGPTLGVGLPGLIVGLGLFGLWLRRAGGIAAG